MENISQNFNNAIYRCGKMSDTTAFHYAYLFVSNFLECSCDNYYSQEKFSFQNITFFSPSILAKLFLNQPSSYFSMSIAKEKKFL